MNSSASDLYSGRLGEEYLSAADEFATKHKEVAIGLLGLRSGSKVLDVGCGTGFDLARMAPLVGPDGQICGIDLNNESVAVSKARLASHIAKPSTDLRVGDVYRIPFPDNYFDAVHAERLFLHLERPRVAIEEIARVLRPGGRFVATETDGGSRSVDSRFYKTERTLAQFWASTRKNGYAGRQMYRLVQEAGFVEVSAYPTAYHITDYELFRRLSRSDVDERVARKKGLVRWWPLRRYRRELEKLALNGRFFCAFNVVTVAGEVPT